MSARINTTQEIVAMSNNYIKTPNERVSIIEKLWSSGGYKYIEIFAQITNIEINELNDWVNEHYHRKRKWRYKKVPIVYIEPPIPDSTPHAIDSKEAAEVAKMVAGGCGEERYGRRNTFSAMIENVARKL